MIDAKSLPSDLMPMREAARALGLNWQTLDLWRRKGRIRGWMIGARWRVSVSEVVNVPSRRKGNPDLQKNRRGTERLDRRVWLKLGNGPDPQDVDTSYKYYRDSATGEWSVRITARPIVPVCESAEPIAPGETGK